MLITKTRIRIWRALGSINALGAAIHILLAIAFFLSGHYWRGANSVFWMSACLVGAYIAYTTAEGWERENNASHSNR